MDSSWLAPFSVLSAVGLLLISTSARYSALHQYLRKRKKEISENTDKLEFRRAYLLSVALVLLYLAASTLCLTTVFVFSAEVFKLSSKKILVSGLALGVILVTASTVFLIRESKVMLQIHSKESF